MKCEIKKNGNVTIFAIRGNVTYNRLNHMDEFRVAIKGEVMQSSTDRFLVDLDDVGMIDSSGVWFIVSAYKTVLARKGKFAIIHTNDTVKNVLETVGLVPHHFKAYENENEALTAI